MTMRRPDDLPTFDPWPPHRSFALASLAAAALLFGCDATGGDGDVDPGADAEVMLDGGGAGGAEADQGVEPEIEPPAAIEAVAGDLTYVTYRAGGGDIFSVLADGTLRQRISSVTAWWTHHAVGPDPRYVAALRHSAGVDGRPDLDSPAEAWVLDVRERRAWPISPAGCDAGGGGIGWQNDNLVMFAVSCDGGPAVAYLYPFSDESRDEGLLLSATDHEAAVGDVFPVVNTSFFAYTVETEACAGGRCVTKPEIWLGDYELGTRCRLTDGDPEFVDTSTIDGGRRALGDHAPSFNRDLAGVIFSRNVGGKPAGPGGHFDAFRVGVDLGAFFDGDPECVQGGTLVNLSSNGIDERYLTVDGGEAVGHERYPQPSAGSRAPAGRVLVTGQTFEPDGATSAAWIIEVGGARRPVTDAGSWSDYARWVVDDYMLTGER